MDKPDSNEEKIDAEKNLSIWEKGDIILARIFHQLTRDHHANLCNGVSRDGAKRHLANIRARNGD